MHAFTVRPSTNPLAQLCELVSGKSVERNEIHLLSRNKKECSEIFGFEETNLSHGTAEHFEL